MRLRILTMGGALLAGAALLGGDVLASSHREAPFITKNPKVDATDFYMFSSYEPGRAGFVTLLANYLPLEDQYGGPNYFTMDPEALYEIHVDNDGDAKEDLTFQFQFDNTLAGGGKGVELEVGPAGATKKVAIPLIQAGGITAGDSSKLNLEESYTVKLVRGARRTGTAADVVKSGTTTTKFIKPVDNIGSKTLPNYAAYAAQYVYEVDIPGCTPPAGKKARLFVGQRDDAFRVNLGAIFDLIHLNPLGPDDAAADSLEGKNVTTIALEVPASCLNAADDTVIGAWTTASVRQARVINPTATYTQPSREGGPWVQVSRLGMPLVNEVVIGLRDKDRFNSSEPKDDGQFIDYVTNPTLPELVEIVFGAAVAPAPNVFPRADLVTAFLTGVPNVNKTNTPSEMLRLNTAIPATASANQVYLGAAGCVVDGQLNTSAPGCDPAGFPNGRRPGDDVVDIALRVAEGYLLPTAMAPTGHAPLTDGVKVSSAQIDAAFPYLRTPLPGASD